MAPESLRFDTLLRLTGAVDRGLLWNDYNLTSTDDLKLVSIPEEIEPEGSINLADELYELWSKDSLDPLMDCDQKISTPQTVTTPFDNFIVKHNNQEDRAIIITILAETWSYSLFIPLSSGMQDKKYSSVDEFNKDKDFRNLRDDYLDKNPGFLRDSDDRPTKLLAILAVIYTPNGISWSYKLFTKSTIGMVAASAREKGLDLSGWSKDVHLILACVNSPQVDQRFVITELQKERLTLGEPGHVFYFYSGADSRVLWEFGRSGKMVFHPSGTIKTMKLDDIAKI
ncbi:hypothetical protein N7512_003026 [Penicillium capsulatum]|nr:hypothetical protein N7512_003026 [Penicillium capsulatum]